MNSSILFTPHLNPLPEGEERAEEWHLYPLPMRDERAVE